MEKQTIKNHYISQFIIRRFSDAINVFDFESKELRESRPSNKVFFKRYLYSQELEDSLNNNLEKPFSTLLKNKLSEKEVSITREELSLVKKYMFITSLRCKNPAEFKVFMMGFTNNANAFFEIKDSISEVKCSLKPISEFTEESSVIFNNSLLALLDYKFNLDIMVKMKTDQRLPKEVAAWALSFMYSYLAIWDAPEDEEFVLSDQGIVSEYEGFHMITGGIDCSKISYLFSKAKSNEQLAPYYFDSFGTSIMMYENYDLFNISSKRCIVAINPFFRQYFGARARVGANQYDVPYPEVWPAIIQNKSLFAMPKNKYLFEGLYLPFDTFEYEAKTLTKKELIYVNSLMISQTKSVVGFNNPKSIYSSFRFALEEKAMFESVTKLDEKPFDIGVNYLRGLVDDPINKICEWCESNGAKLEVPVETLFDEMVRNIYKDFDSNIYIYEWLLKDETKLYECAQLDFLGKGDKNKKMEFIKNKYKQLKEHHNEKDICKKEY